MPGRFLRNLLICLLLPIAGAQAASWITQPVVVMVPPSVDSGWVGSTQFKFENPGGGRIMYTLDGNPPAKETRGSSTQYVVGSIITLNATTTLRAIHVANGLVSDELQKDFIRAKAPPPTARYGGNAHFYPALPCSLSVGPTQNTATIRYTLTDTGVGPTTPVYTGPFQVTKTSTLRAFTQAAGYDDSDPMVMDFVLDPAATPAITPDAGKFTTSTITVHIRTTTPGAHIRYTTDPNATVDKWNLLTADSLVLQGGHDGDSIMLRAQAFVSQYQVSAIASTKYYYLPAVATPTVSPASPYTFYDTLSIQMASATAGASIRYTDDGTAPTPTSKDGSARIRLTKPSNLHAQAYKANHENSGIAIFSFPMRLTQPQADKQDQDFNAPFTVKLHAINPSAFIFYTLDGTAPVLSGNKVANASQYDSTVGVQIGPQTTTLSAIAVVEGIASDPATYTYTYKQKITSLTAPRIDPPSQEFTDTLSIRLTADDPTAEIRYTLTTDGRDPVQTDALAGTAAIRLDSSAVLRCRAFPKAGTPNPLDPSGVVEARYTLKPSQPFASPMPAADPLPAGSIIMLRTKTKHGIIHYALADGVDLETTQGFPDSVPVTLNASCTVRAVTIVGSGTSRLASGVFSAHYEIFNSAPSETLTVAGTRTLTGGIVFLNQSAQAILAKAHTADGLGLTGFADMSLVMSLQPVQAGQSIKVTFTKPADLPGSLYRSANGKVDFVANGDSIDVTVPGEYFVARDVSPPVITILKQVPKAGDSTTVRISVADNVSNPTCDIASPGVKGGSIARKPDAQGVVVVNVKGSGSDLKPLWLRITAHDAYDSTKLPADPSAKLYVSQLWSKVATPDVFVIGQGEGDELWDMAGLPVGTGSGTKWSDLRNANADLQACVWQEGTGYVTLDDSVDLKEGMAFWVGSHSRYSALSLPQLRAGESETDGNYRIRIKPGWNQITSPSLDRVYWPVTPAVSKAKRGTLKAPYRFVRDSDELWHQTDTLEPWIGYFVYFYGDHDTLITAYTDPAKRPAAKIAADVSPGIGLTLAAGSAPSLRLGARTWAEDAAGPEDEPDPPAWGKRWSAWAQRGNSRLLTDLVRFEPGAVARWQVVLEPGRTGAAGAASLGVRQGDWPAGYQAWALSRTRGIKFPLTTGAAVPLSPNASDTLSVYVGPQEALSAIGELAKAPVNVAAFAFALEKAAGRTVLRVDLPWSAQIDATIWSVSGRRLASARSNGTVLPGIYRLPIESGDGAQAAVLRLRLNGESGNRDFARRIAW